MVCPNLLPPNPDAGCPQQVLLTQGFALESEVWVSLGEGLMVMVSWGNLSWRCLKAGLRGRGEQQHPSRCCWDSWASCMQSTRLHPHSQAPLPNVKTLVSREGKGSWRRQKGPPSSSLTPP